MLDFPQLLFVHVFCTFKRSFCVQEHTYPELNDVQQYGLPRLILFFVGWKCRLICSDAPRICLFLCPHHKQFFRPQTSGEFPFPSLVRSVSTGRSNNVIYFMFGLLIICLDLTLCDNYHFVENWPLRLSSDFLKLEMDYNLILSPPPLLLHHSGFSGCSVCSLHEPQCAAVLSRFSGGHENT